MWWTSILKGQLSDIVSINITMHSVDCNIRCPQHIIHTPNQFLIKSKMAAGGDSVSALEASKT